MSAPAAPGPGLAIESATAHVEVAAFGADGAPLATGGEDVGHGHTRRLTAMSADVLAQAGLHARDLRWIATDLGPGSFTGVRVGIATAQALAYAAGAARYGASSLASLAAAVSAAGVRRALIVPMVPAGRRDAYAGWFRVDARGEVRVIAAPIVGPIERIVARGHEMQRVLGSVSPRASGLRVAGPGAARWHDELERAWPGATADLVRAEGLSALDLARAARSDRGPAAGLPAAGAVDRPAYVRSAQAEERVRREIVARDPVHLRAMELADVPALTALEQMIFPDPWSAGFFRSELGAVGTHARIAERDGAIAGYLVAWMGEGEGHVGNVAVAPDHRRRGIAHALLRELLAAAVRLGVQRLTLEVRATNDAAQALYREHGFHAVALRRAYYADTGEDALVMARQEPPAGG